MVEFHCTQQNPNMNLLTLCLFIIYKLKVQYLVDPYYKCLMLLMIKLILIGYFVKFARETIQYIEKVLDREIHIIKASKRFKKKGKIDYTNRIIKMFSKSIPGFLL